MMIMAVLSRNVPEQYHNREVQYIWTILFGPLGESMRPGLSLQMMLITRIAWTR